VSSRDENLKRAETAGESWKTPARGKSQKRKTIAPVGENQKSAEEAFPGLPASQPAHP
jgi:hypothetical protein